MSSPDATCHPVFDVVLLSSTDQDDTWSVIGVCFVFCDSRCADHLQAQYPARCDSLSTLVLFSLDAWFAMSTKRPRDAHDVTDLWISKRTGEISTFDLALEKMIIDLGNLSIANSASVVDCTRHWYWDDKLRRWWRWSEATHSWWSGGQEWIKGGE